ncbi:MAG: hypothetical protein ACFB16_05430, partial [Phormidesmis sp.]
MHWLRAAYWTRLSDRAIVSTWLGLVVLSISLLLSALAFPLSPAVGATIMLLWLLVALRSGAVRRELAASWRSLPKLAWAWYGLCVIAIAAFATQPVTWIDTG